MDWPNVHWSFTDAAKAQKDKAPFAPSRAAERAYERRLKSVTDQVVSVLKTAQNPSDAEKLLREYSRVLEPWARQTSANMLGGLARNNDAAWKRTASRMGMDMRLFMTGDPVGRVVAERIEANVTLIRDIPNLVADQIAERVREGLITGHRAESFADEVADIGYMSLSRAKTIARTEVSKASTALTQGRAESVGSEGYIWRTARDGATRDSHRAMEGVFVPWAKPPRVDNMTGHAGEFPNCRCYPEPVIPMDDRRKTFAVSLPTQMQERASGQQKLISHWERSPGSEAVRHVPGKPLVNADRAWLPPGKLTDYALNPEHPSGRDKARVFKALLDMRREHAAELERQLLEGVREIPAVREGRKSSDGEKFTALVPVRGPNGRTLEVKTVWIYEKKNGAVKTAPRLVTTYIP